MNNNPDPFADFDPFEFTCNYCGKKHVFTEEEIEKVKQKVSGTDNEYYILCKMCKTGHMQPPELVLIPNPEDFK